MIKSIRRIYPLYFLIDLILIELTFYIVYLLKYNSLKDISSVKIDTPNFQEYSFVFILWTIFLIISFKRRNLYTTDRSLTIPREISRVIISVFYSSFLILAVIFFAKYKFFSRSVFTESFLSLCLSLSVWRIVKKIIFRKLFSKGIYNTDVLIAGAGRIGKVVLEEIKKNPHWGFKVVGFLDDNKKENIGKFSILGKLGDFDVIAKKHFVDELIITIPSEREVVSELIKKARCLHLGVRVVPENFEEPLLFLSINHLGIIPLLTYQERKWHPGESALKRLFDFVASFFTLIILLPLFLVIGILIRLTSKGPIFYVQKRGGFRGRKFNLYKFRSMIVEADKLKDALLEKNEVKDGVIFKIKDDPRITSVGRFLRKYSLDEIPQLFNVLRGDMSIVGPRPFLVNEVNQFDYTHMPRLNIRPGITGLAQVRGRSDLSFYRWVKWDIWYINNWSFGLDLKILMWTVPVVLKGKGAY